MADNYIDSLGIHVQTVTEIRDSLVAAYRSIYGSDISVSSDTPDGQRINIEAQAKADVLDYSKQVYNSFDVDTVIGSAQDRLYKINNVYRQNAAYTFVTVDVTTTAPVNLQGLDENIESASGTGYTVSDSIGTNFILANSVSLTSAGTFSLEFRAEKLGQVDVAPNTITNMVTVVAGVSGVVNLSKQYITGGNQETDSAFRVRRNKSTAISAQGFNDALTGKLLAIPNVTSAVVYENTPTNKEIPQSSASSAIWCIVEGGSDANIAQMIYANRTLGCAMVGETSYTLTRIDGTSFTAYFDRPQATPLYIKLTVKSRVGLVPNDAKIKQLLSQNMTFGVYQTVTITDIVVALNELDPTDYVVDCSLSNNGTTYGASATPSTKDKYFTLSVDDIDVTVQ